LLARQTRPEQSYDWLQSLRSGEESAFAEFIDKYKEIVFLCCRGLGLKDDEVEDVASETFLAAYRGLGQYRGQSELSTWLWSIAYRQAINHLRKNRRKWRLWTEPDESAVGEPRAKEPEPVSAAQNSEEADIIWAAVERLPRLWAMAIILYYREEKCIADIAKIMQARKNTVKTYLFRGREKLKEMLAASFSSPIGAHRTAAGIESASVNG
jgi:RNA polymerase sigma factor (sigma-70 family)